MTTTEPLPARHCIARALELDGTGYPVEHVERFPNLFHATIAHARTLEEYGYQPPQPVDPIRKRAREICAEIYAGAGYQFVVKSIIAGGWDGHPMMQATEKALREPGL